MKFSYLKKIKRNAGMTYAELIVVLGIFSAISGVVIFNYSDFQGKINIRDLSSQIALKIVEAQKSAMAGQSTIQNTSTSWRPAYGVVFDMSDDKSFVYFADSNNNKEYDDSSCVLPATAGGGECLDKINITKGNAISDLKIYYQIDDSNEIYDSVKYVSFTFTRPDSGAVIRTDIENPARISYAKITIVSPAGISRDINVYPSGRITFK